MKSLAFVCVAAFAAGPAFAQETDEARASYDEAVRCAGQFMWVLNASSGGQPPVQEYALEERVAGLSKFEALAREQAAMLDPVPDVGSDMLDVSDENIVAFFDDPDSVEDDLYACAVKIGLRDAE